MTSIASMKAKLVKVLMSSTGARRLIFGQESAIEDVAFLSKLLVDKYFVMSFSTPSSPSLFSLPENNYLCSMLVANKARVVLKSMFSYNPARKSADNTKIYEITINHVRKLNQETFF